MKKYKVGAAFRFLLACWATLTLHCRFEIFQGGFPDVPLLNGLNKLQNTFQGPDFADLFVVAAIYMLLRFVSRKEEKPDMAFGVLSLLLSVTLLAAISFEKFNSAILLIGNSYQILVTVFCVIGFSVILYGIFRGLYFLLENNILRKEEALALSFLEKHFQLIGFIIIFLGWLPWILLNYPGSGCPDSMLQLKQFLGDEPWAAGHPPLSTIIMGSLFTLGSWIADANLGFFLYCLFQTCVGAGIFSLSMKKVWKLGLPVKWCMLGIVYFAFTPLWGAYAQWVEKDLLYAEIVVLQTICMMELLIKKECSKKDAVLLACSSLGAVFLRNNGIYAVLPALLLLGIFFKGASRKKVLAVALIVFALYEGAIKVLYPALGLQGFSMAESLSIPFQQTARYVCEYPEEVTEYERSVIDREFGYEVMANYDPVISDPIKIHYKDIDTAEYFKVWFQMFWKHPGTYVAAFVNKTYGYIAPVSQNIEAWIQQQYYDYYEGLGVHHTLDINTSHILVNIWNLSMNLPLVKYLCSPGLYTWIVIVLALILYKRKRYSALILFVPAIMNILVCLASPLASAIRYELPTVASVPLLIGWAYFSLHNPEKQE